MHFGYAHVSAKDQRLDTQLEQLKAAGFECLFQEKSAVRPRIGRCSPSYWATLRAGDTVTVARLNRLGRNSAHIMQVVADLHAR